MDAFKSSSLLDSLKKVVEKPSLFPPSILYLKSHNTPRIETEKEEGRRRICHEAEFESSKILEAPCGCSGTLKVVVIKAVGILLPAYLLIRIITLIQNGVIRPHLDFGDTIGYHIARN
nr:E3 ubiquitin-protein ligase MARCH4 [Ipomoea batatas]